MKKREELFWAHMPPPGDWVLGAEFEYQGKLVKVVNYNSTGIPTLTIEYEVSMIFEVPFIWSEHPFLIGVLTGAVIFLLLLLTI